MFVGCHMFIAYLLVPNILAKSREEIAPHLTDVFILWHLAQRVRAKGRGEGQCESWDRPSPAHRPSPVVLRTGARGRLRLWFRLRITSRHTPPSGGNSTHALCGITHALSPLTSDPPAALELGAAGPGSSNSRPRGRAATMVRPEMGAARGRGRPFRSRVRGGELRPGCGSRAPPRAGREAGSGGVVPGGPLRALAASGRRRVVWPESREGLAGRKMPSKCGRGLQPMSAQPQREARADPGAPAWPRR